MKTHNHYEEWCYRIHIISADINEYDSLEDFYINTGEKNHILENAREFKRNQWKTVRKSNDAFGRSSTYKGLRDEIRNHGIRLTENFVTGYVLEEERIPSNGDEIFTTIALIEFKTHYLWFNYEGLVIH